MRRAFLAACVILAGCSLLVDTSGLSNGDATPRDAGPTDALAGDAADGSTNAASDAAPDHQDAAPLDPSIVAQWSLDETSGTVAHDSSGHGHDGILTDAVWTDAGHASGALDFTGASGEVTVGPSSDFDRAADESFTITAWGKPSGTLSHSFLLSVSFGASSAAFGLEAMDDSHINYFCGEFADGGTGPAHIAITQVPLAVGQWSHIAAVIEKGTDVRMYFNGVRVGTGTADATPRKALQVLLGANNYGAHFKGAIDNVRFYRRALSDAEVAADRDR